MNSGYLYIALTIFLTVYGQLVFKWQVSQAGGLPAGIGERLQFLFHMVLNPWIVSAYLAAFAASLCWIAALTRFELSYAYPFISITFILVLVLSSFLFQEHITTPRIIGLILITLGIIIGSQK